MKTKDKETKCYPEKFIKNHHCRNDSCNAIYSLGVVGAIFYFLHGATTLGMILLGIGKAIFWPAILMFKLLTYLQM